MFTNSKVERTFSTMKVIKTDRCKTLKSDTLEDLMEVTVEGPSLENFSADIAVELWWSDHSRRRNQRPRKEYRKRKCEDEDSAEERQLVNTDNFSLEHLG